MARNKAQHRPAPDLWECVGTCFACVPDCDRRDRKESPGSEAKDKAVEQEKHCGGDMRGTRAGAGPDRGPLMSAQKNRMEGPGNA